MTTVISNTKKHTKSLLLAVLLLASGTLITFALLVANNSNQIQQTWRELETLHSEEIRYLLDLNSALGYDGLIHHLKNFILRGEPIYHHRFRESLGKAMVSTQHYLDLNLDENERKAMLDVKRVLLQYDTAASQVESLHRGTITPKEIDQYIGMDKPANIVVTPREIDHLTRVDDKSLIEALTYLNRKLALSEDSPSGNSKTILLANLRSSLGYNGVIHHFKNAILNNAENPLQLARTAIERVEKLLKRFDSHSLTSHELSAIQQLAQTMEKYAEALVKVQQLHQQKRDPREIDKQTEVSPEIALNALMTLTHEIALENELRTQQAESDLGEIQARASNGAIITVFAVILIIVVSLWSQMDHLRYERSIALAERRLGAILDNTADAIIVTNEYGVITEFNSAAEKMFGYSSNEIIGQNVSLIMPEKHAQKHDEYLQRYREIGVAKIIGIGRETIARHSDGHEFPITLSVGKSKVNNQTAFTGIVRDVTADYKMRDALIREKNNAEEANKAKSKFLASMSHELRTPLNAIIGLSQLLITDPKQPPDQQTREALEDIHNSGRHLLSLINDVLDYAKLENNNLNLEIAAIDPMECLHSAITMTQPQAEKFEVSIKTLGEESLPLILADALRVRQILLNFLSNAVKYNQRGGTITIHANEHNGMLRFNIRDTGKGIPLEQQDQLFTPFKRLDAEGSNIEGTGIGLSISKALVEQLGGSIGFSSTPGSGSTFWFELPLASTAYT